MRNCCFAAAGPNRSTRSTRRLRSEHAEDRGRPPRDAGVDANPKDLPLGVWMARNGAPARIPTSRAVLRVLKVVLRASALVCLPFAPLLRQKRHGLVTPQPPEAGLASVRVRRRPGASRRHRATWFTRRRGGWRHGPHCRHGPRRRGALPLRVEMGGAVHPSSPSTAPRARASGSAFSRSWRQGFFGPPRLRDSPRLRVKSVAR